MNPTMKYKPKREEDTRGTKRYIERIVEEREAEEEIKNYQEEEQLYDDTPQQIQNKLR